jgi:RHS repeat-associated protein
VFSVIGGCQNNGSSPTFSAVESHQIDSINMQDLSIILTVPVRDKSGAIPFSYTLNGSSSCLKGTYWSCGIGLTSNVQWQRYALTGIGPGLAGGYSAKPLGGSAFYLCPDGVTYTMNQSVWVIVDPFGKQHPLPPADFVDQYGCTTHKSFTDQTTDGSGLTLSVLVGPKSTDGYEYIYDGTGLSTDVNWGKYPFETDVYNNSITVTINSGSESVWTDSLGLTALTSGAGPSVGNFKWTDANGATQQLSETFTAWTPIRTKFGCSTPKETNVSGYLITNLNYPDGSTIGLSYESNGDGSYTGRLAGLTLRAGGRVSFAYSGGNNGINCTYGVPPTLTRTTQDGTSTYTWSLTNNGNGNYGNATTVLDNGGNKTVYTFTGLTSTGNAAPPIMQALTAVQRYQGSTTLLTTDLYCYNGISGQPGTCATAVVSQPITEVDVYHTISGMSSSSRTQTKYDTHGNVIYAAKYDFGSSVPTIATTTTYGTWNGQACVSIGNYIYSKTCDEVTVAGNNTLSEIRYSYDSKGNLLTTYVWNGSSWLSNSTPNSYNPNGTIAASHDLANNTTTYSYSSAGYTECTSCTNYPFPTSISRGGLTTSSTWDGLGGVKLTDKDANGNTTTYGYRSATGIADPLWRVMSITNPLGSTVWKTYRSGASPDSANSSLSFNSGNSIQNTTAANDGYGRPINSQTQQSPTSTNYDTVSTSHGWSGNYRAIGSSEPCTTTLGNICAIVHTSFYDPLGRLYQTATANNETSTHTYTQNDELVTLSPAPANESNKQFQKEYDGLGRLRKSCAIGNGSSTTCGQNTGSANGITTSYSYTYAPGSSTTTSTRGSQSRTKTYDAMGRVTQVVTPEGGTWTSYYDSYAVCPIGYRGVNGQLAAVRDPNGNLVCYVYDGLNRLTGVNANGTTCRHFYFDNSTGYSGTIPPGITVSNSSGRMVEAATDNCSGTSLVTDEWFSYDKSGRMTDMWEKTPNSGQYYHSTATFFGNDATNTLQLASPNFYTMTYSLDGKGRWNTLTRGTSSLVTGTAYNAASQPTQVKLTGTQPDQDNYSYDLNTGRMKTFTFQVGDTPASVTGQLAWNANGTLNNLAVTDGFNSGGTQTCYFNPQSGTGKGYDDWGRLLNVSCGPNGSIWNQTFSYDQYDNLTKASSGPGISWNPGYNSTNNRYTMAGASYDFNGNLNADTFHNYEWNEFSKLKSVDRNGTGCATSGECIIYDALGRAVEIDKGSTKTEIWYTQLGKTAYMNGSTISYAYFPTPGGGIALIAGNGTANYYLHKDWLGNARIVSSLDNHTVSSDMAFAPYGEIYKQFGSTATNFQVFTGDTQDIVPGIMDTPNREYHSAAQGRWLSPDPAGSGWNQYAYPRNPNSSIDPTGLKMFTGHGGGIYLGWAAYNATMASMAAFEIGFDDWINSAFSSVPSESYVETHTNTPSNSSDASAGLGVDRILNGAAACASQFAASAAAAFFQVPEAEEDDKEEAERDEEENALEPVKPEERPWQIVPWQYNIMNPGPLPEIIADTFAGGQYSKGVVGEQGWEFDAVYRVRNAGSPVEGRDGTFYSPVPQVGGTQSAIDLAVNPVWGSAGTPGGNPYSNGLNLGEVTCVYLRPGTTVYVGPIGSQGGAWVGGVPGPGGLQIYVPPHP